MKKHLLFSALALFGIVTAQAQDTPFTGYELTTADVEDVYLYNVGTGLWFQNNDKNADYYTTRGELGPRGIDVDLTLLMEDSAGDGYQIDPKFNNNNSLNYSGLYLDTSQSVTTWYFEPNSAVSNGYRICADGGNYPYLGADEDGNLVDTEEFDDDDYNFIWQVVTRDERIEYMTTASADGTEVDATWLIQNATFANNDSRYSNWSISYNNNGSLGSQGVGLGGENPIANMVFEFWCMNDATIYQSITDAPNGTYKFYLQGYQRSSSAGTSYSDSSLTTDWDGDAVLAYDHYVAGTETEVLYYINGTSAQINSIFDEVFTEYGEGHKYNAESVDEYGDVVTTGYYIPNKLNQASYTFFYEDSYWNDAITTSVADGNITVGVKKDSGNYDNWVILDNFTLIYCGESIDLTDVLNTLAAAIASAEALSGSSTDAIDAALAEALANAKTIYESSSDATEIATAATTLNNLITLFNNTTTNAGYLRTIVTLCENEGCTGDAYDTVVDVLANSMDSDEVSDALDAIRMARYLFHAETQEDVYTGNTPSAGEYYIYNVGQKRFLCGGDDWGTHAAVGFPGHLFTLVAGDNGGYIIDTQLQNGSGEHYLNYGGYVDTSTQSEWSFVSVGDGVYNIVRTELDDEETVYMLGYNTSYYARVDTDMEGSTDTNNQWKLVTASDREALLEEASEENPVDASWMIKMPNFNQRDYEITGGWDDESTGAWTHTNGSIYGRGSNYEDFVFECWNADPLEIYQYVEDLYPGYYQVSVQGYYRDGSREVHAATVDAGETPQQLAVFSLTGIDSEEVTTLLMPIHTYADCNPGVGWDSETAAGEFPDACTAAYKFFWLGYYTNSAWVEVGDDGLLEIKVTKEGGSEYDWVVLDNFRLVYYGETQPTAITGISDETTATSNSKIYNLQGIQVKDASQRGVYIKDGKKFVVK